MPKGQIWYEFWIGCAQCEYHEPLGARTHADAQRIARELGYRYRKGIGWICRDCAPQQRV